MKGHECPNDGAATSSSAAEVHLETLEGSLAKAEAQLDASDDGRQIGEKIQISHVTQGLSILLLPRTTVCMLG